MIRLALLSEAPPLLALLCTYLVHSTVLVAVIWSLAALLRRQPAISNQLWRLALVAPLVSTALAWLLPVRFTLAPRPPAGVAPVPAMADFAPSAGMDPGAGLAEVASAPEPAFAWPSLLLSLALLAAVVALVRLAVLGVRLAHFRRDLAHRRPLTDGSARQRLDQLCDRAGLAPVALTVSERVTVPMALGNAPSRREICLPAQAREGLAPAELDAVLAHELAHLERGDNRWLTVASLLEAVLFLQPLTGVIRRRLADTAELACDVRAVELTGSSRALARSLAEVASWNLGGDPVLPVSAMAHRGGLLLRRVERLLADDGRIGRPGGKLRVIGLGALVVVLAVLLPSVGGAPVDQDQAAPGHLPGMALAAPAAPSVPSVPKATAAANRFDPPAAAPSAGSMPGPMPGMPMPMPPLGDLAAPVGDLVGNVLNQVLPRALGSAGQLGPLAMRQAGLEMQLEGLEKRRSQGRATSAEIGQIPALRGQLAEARKQLEQAEKKLERDMEVWEKTHGKELERRMEKWGEEYGKRMEKWGEEYGRQMEKWGEQYGKDWERWGEEFGKRMSEQALRAQQRRDQVPQDQVPRDQVPRATPPRPQR